ncbi:retention module-containing protein [Pseudoteredinibacter isoporae]|uniref:CshA-type fibril repeat protein n=1 Tax=Pseudoteredinibacter isoporae TaxID=570281 RepID=A0A7X0MWR4_9GAMM|nr:retention module-containing protein [Pseudoteredinibacter isoporae]MBB6521224.1 CshA-type fibril repeat protein [Pseudoteredinibacter isoporae]NHO86782.1 retention module-containing protein [Pseudoteredinibacter isoporae]
MVENNSTSTSFLSAQEGSTGPAYEVSADAQVIGLKGDVSIQRSGEQSSQTLNNNDLVAIGDTIKTGVDAAVVIRFSNGSLLTLGHEQSAKIDAAMIRLLQDDSVQQVAEAIEEIDFAKLEEGLAQGLNLEELLPATAAGPGTGGGGNGSSVGTGVRFELTGDETIPTAGFGTGTFGNGLADGTPENGITDTAPEAADDNDEVSSLSVATGNVVTGIDSGGDANTLDGNVDDSGPNGFGDIIVVGVALGDTQTPLNDGSGVGVTLESDRGTLVLNSDGSYTYTPNRTATGTDVFTYTIVDNDDDLSTATLSIAIDATPDLQVPNNDDNPDTPEGNAQAQALGTAVFEAALTDGTGELSDGDGGNNSDPREETSGSIRYFQGDDEGTVTIGGVVVAVNGVLQTSTVNGNFGVLEITSVTDTEITYNYRLNDAVDHSAGPVTENFSVSVSDNDGNAADDASANLQIRIIDDSPIANSQSDSIDGSLQATGNVLTGIDIPSGDSNSTDGVADVVGADDPGFVASVAAGDQATASGGVGVAVSSDKGTLILQADGSYTYTANPGVFGEDIFTYVLSDADGSTESATLTINVDAANTLADNDESASGLQGATISGNVLDNSSNPDGPEDASVASFSIPGDTTQYQPGDTAIISGIGSITIAASGTYTFVPLPGFAGTVPSISYTVTDSLNVVDSDLNLTVIDPLVPPIAVSDVVSSATPGSTVTISVLSNDSDPDGFLVASSVVISGAPGNGKTLDVSGQGVWQVQPNGTITFTPEVGFVGNPNPITYSVNDNDGLAASAQVTVNYQVNVVVDDITVSEGDNAVFSIQVSNAEANSVINLSLQDGTGANAANAPADYNASLLEYSLDNGASWQSLPASGDVNLPSGGSPLILLRTDTVIDNLDENSEVFDLSVSLSSGSDVVNDSAQATILDGDVPNVAVAGQTVNEGVNIEFQVQVQNAAANSTVTLSLNDGQGADAAVQGVDFNTGLYQYRLSVSDPWQDVPAGGVINLPTGGNQTIFVQTNTVIDALDENLENLSLAAELNSNGAIANGSAQGFITDINTPTVNVGQPNTGTGDVTVDEGDDAVFGVVVGNAAVGSVLTLTLTDDTANSPLDYNDGQFQYREAGTSTWIDVPANGQITLTGGGNQTLDVRTNTLTDNLDEPTERFTLNADLNSNGTNVSDVGNGFINDTNTPTVNVGQPNTGTGDVTVDEGVDAVFGVVVGNAAAGAILTLTLTDGTAGSPLDYNDGQFQYREAGTSTWIDVPANGQITLGNGGNQILDVRTNTLVDALDEPTESFTLTADLNSAGSNVSDVGNGFINDTNTPTVNVGQPNTGTGDVTVDEGIDAVFGVVVGNAATGAILTLTLTDGTAGSPLDYNDGQFQYREAGTSTWIDVPANGQITLTNGGNQTLDVRTNTLVDALDESTESFTLTADLNSNGTNVSDVGNGFINDLNTPTVNVGQPNTGTGDVTVDEGVDAVFGVVVGSAAAGSTLTLTLTDGTAGSPLDYNDGQFQYREAGTSTWIDVPANGQITLTNGGDQTLDVRTNTLVDALDEPTESFTLTADLNSNGTNVSDVGNGFINDLNTPTVNVGQPNTGTGDVTVDEGVDAVFGVVVGSAAAGSTLTLTLTDGSAGSPLDYNDGQFQYREAGTSTWIDVPANGQITLTNGGNQTLDVRTNTLVDALDEPTESFTLTADLNSNGTNVSDVGNGFINDLNTPTVNVGQPNTGTGDVTVDEGVDAVFGVVVGSAAAGSTLTLTLTDGTAGSPLDYNDGQFQYREAGTSTWIDVPANGQITLTNGGDQTLDVRTNTLVDALDEPTESFTLTADLNSNGTNVSDVGNGFINDLNTPTVNVGQPNTGTGDVTVDEGVDAVFGVVVGSAAAGSTLTLTLTDGTAGSPLDYNDGQFQYREAGTSTWIDVPANGQITLSNGGNQTLDVRTNTLTDDLDEPTESFTLTADLNSNGTNVSDVGNGFINDLNTPTVNVGQPNTGTGDVTVDEGVDAVFGVVVGSAAAGSTLTLTLTDGTAGSPLDYNDGQFQYREAGTSTWIDVPANGQITLTNGGNQTLDVRTNTLTDDLDEPTESFTLTADLNSNGTNVSDVGNGFINDLNTPTVNVGQPNTGTGDVTVDEGVDAVFGVVVGSAAAGSTLTLTLTDGTAGSPLDYNDGQFQYREAGTSTWIDVPANGQITLTNGGNQTLDVRTNTLTDDLDEPTESFTLTADLNSNGTNVSDVGNGFINDLNTPTVNVGQPNTGTGDVTVDEGVDAVFGVVVGSAAAGSTLTLTLTDGTAGSPLDYNDGQFQYREAGSSTWIDVPANGQITLTNGGNQTLDVRTNTLTDDLDEPTENFTLTADLNSNGTNVSDVGNGFINDINTPTINVGQPNTGTGDVTVDEGDNAIFAVVVGDAAPNSQVELSLISGTADSPADFNATLFEYRLGDSGPWLTVPANGIVDLPAGGDQLIQVRTDTVADTIDEPDENFTLRAELVSNGSNIVDTGLGTILDNDEAPNNLQVTAATVSEEGIAPDGLPDNVGSPSDTTDSATATGSISFDDAGDNNPFSFTLTGPSGVTSGGNAVTWSYDSGSGTLTGSYNDGGTPVNVATVVLGSLSSSAGSHSMDYTVTFERAIDHPGVDQEDVLDLQFGITVDDGVNPVANSNFTVSVEDDSPQVEDVTRQIDVPPAQTNLMIVLDISGSMAGSNLALAKDAINRLIDTYEANGDVRVTVITFDTSADIELPYWQSSSTAKDDVDALTAGGWTNYDGALALAQTAFDSANNGNMLPNAKNVLYFLSDGEPTAADGNTSVLANSPIVTQGSNPGHLDFGIQAAEESAWITFLNNNDVDAFSFGMGPGPSLASLNPIAYDGENGSDKNAIQVDDLNDLDDALQSTVEIPQVQGNLLGNLGGQFGADGGVILEFIDRRDTPNDTSDDVLYRYNRITDQITNTSTGAVTNGQNLVITTALGATLTVDMVSGDYSYDANYQITNNVSEYFGFRLHDTDGDVSINSDPGAQDPNNAMLTFNVVRESSGSSPLRIVRGDPQTASEDESLVMASSLDGLMTPSASLFSEQGFMQDFEIPQLALQSIDMQNFEVPVSLEFGDILESLAPESLEQWLTDSTMETAAQRQIQEVDPAEQAANDVYDFYVHESAINNAIMQDEIALF